MNKKILLIMMILLVPTALAWSITDFVRYVPEKSTEQCLTSCYSTYEITNPTLSTITLDEASWWFSFRTNKDMTIKNANTISDLQNFHIWKNDWQKVQDNVTIKLPSECKIESVLLNTTFSCPAQTQLIQFNNTEIVQSSVDIMNFTIAPLSKINLTISGTKKIDSSIDNIPVISLAGNTYVGTQWAWWNSSWNNRIELKLAVNGTIDTNHVLDTIELNISQIPNLYCSNNGCTDIRILINDTISNFVEIGHQIKNNSVLPSLQMLIIPINYTTTGINYSMFLYFNNTAATNTTIQFINFTDDMSSCMSSRWSTQSGIMTQDNSIWKGLNQHSCATNAVAPQDYVRTVDSLGSSIKAVIVMMFHNSSSSTSAQGMATNSNIEIIGTCPVTTDNITIYNCQASTNQTRVTAWHSLKADEVNNVWVLDGKRLSGTGQPNGTAGKVDIGQFSGNTVAAWFGRYREAFWNINYYNNDTTVTFGALETFSPSLSTGDCVINSNLLNVSAIEHDSQIAELNLTFNKTNVTSVSATFIYGSTIITPDKFITANDTATNNTLFRAYFNASIVNTNATNVSASWNNVICNLNNGTVNSFNISRGQVIGFAHRDQNTNFTNGVGEGTLQNYTINISLFKTVYYANLTFFENGTRQNNATTNFTSPMIDNLNESFYNITNFQTTLVINNNTAQPFNFEMLVFYTNGSTKLINSSIQNQTLTWSYIPDGVISLSQSIERTVINITNNITIINNAVISNVVSVLQFNNTNTSSATYNNISNQYSFVNQIFTDLVSGTNRDYNTTIRGYFNITLGTNSVIRNSTLSNTTTRVFAVYLGNCSAGISNNQSINYTIKDQSTLIAINPSTLLANYVVWYTNQSTNRTYTVSSTGNTHAACISPDFVSYTATRQLLASAALYNSKTTFFGPFMAMTPVQNIDLFLINSTSINYAQVIVNIVDENDVAQENNLVTIERFDNITNFTMVDSKLTDFQGNAPFNLDTTLLYRINISNNGVLRTLSSLQPASVGPFQILSTPLTFRVLSGSSASLTKLLAVINVQHNLSFINSSKQFRLDYNDLQNITDLVCIKVDYFNLSGKNSYGNNCSNAQSGTIYFGIGSTNGSFTAYATGHAADPQEIIFETLNIIFPGVGLFGREGYVWALILTGTTALIGAVVTGANPVGMILGTMLGIGVSNMLSLVAVGWTVFLGLGIIGGIMLYYLKT